MAGKAQKPKPKAVKPEVKVKPTKKVAPKKPPSRKAVVAKNTPAEAAKPSKEESKAPKTPVAKKSSGKKKTPRPSARDKLIMAERQDLVYQLYRRHGASVREISRVLAEKGYTRISKTTIGRDLQEAIASNSLRRDLSRDDMLETLIDGVRDIQAAFASKALKEKDVQAGKLLLDCSKEIDRLTGTSKNSEATTDAKTALAKLLGVEPEAIEDGSESV